jgi:hypothetical protein
MWQKNDILEDKVNYLYSYYTIIKEQKSVLNNINIYLHNFPASCFSELLPLILAYLQIYRKRTQSFYW